MADLLEHVSRSFFAHIYLTIRSRRIAANLKRFEITDQLSLMALVGVLKQLPCQDLTRHGLVNKP